MIRAIPSGSPSPCSGPRKLIRPDVALCLDLPPHLPPVAAALLPTSQDVRLVGRQGTDRARSVPSFRWSR